jgi:hypothetical protein
MRGGRKPRVVEFTSNWAEASGSDVVPIETAPANLAVLVNADEKNTVCVLLLLLKALALTVLTFTL